VYAQSSNFFLFFPSSADEGGEGLLIPKEGNQPDQDKSGFYIEKNCTASITSVYLSTSSVLLSGGLWYYGKPQI